MEIEKKKGKNPNFSLCDVIFAFFTFSFNFNFIRQPPKNFMTN